MTRLLVSDHTEDAESGVLFCNECGEMVDATQGTPYTWRRVILLINTPVAVPDGSAFDEVYNRVSDVIFCGDCLQDRLQESVFEFDEAFGKEPVEVHRKV